MSRHDDTRLLEAKAIPIEEVVDRLGIEGLRRGGNELIGPCPKCGGDDRFGINLRSHKFQCRICGIKGGDTVGLVQSVVELSFPKAIEWLVGEEQVTVSPEEREARRARAQKQKEKRDRDAARYKRYAIGDARGIWRRAEGHPRDMLRHYFCQRGIPPAKLPSMPSIRFLPQHSYVKKIKSENVTLHTGPCMIANVQAPDGRVQAVHQTWIDPNPPHGKAKIRHAGEDFPAKLVRGSKKGNAIRLITPQKYDTLVMGEGIETTLSAYIANAAPGAAYWAGVDLGNMAGKMVRQDGVKHSGIPDMTDDEAFIPPPWVKRFYLIMDGDSAPKETFAKVSSGAKRAMAMVPGLVAKIVRAEPGKDLNDMLVSTEERQRDG